MQDVVADSKVTVVERISDIPSQILELLSFSENGMVPAQAVEELFVLTRVLFAGYYREALFLHVPIKSQHV